MNRDKIIELARDAGFAMENSAAIQAAERFFALATAHEREACAKVCDDLIEQRFGKHLSFDMIAAAIRARGQA